jgi:hypothetical protein
MLSLSTMIHISGRQQVTTGMNLFAIKGPNEVFQCAPANAIARAQDDEFINSPQIGFYRV